MCQRLQFQKEANLGFKSWSHLMLMSRHSNVTLACLTSVYEEGSCFLRPWKRLRNTYQKGRRRHWREEYGGNKGAILRRRKCFSVFKVVKIEGQDQCKKQWIFFKTGISETWWGWNACSQLSAPDLVVVEWQNHSFISFQYWESWNSLHKVACKEQNVPPVPEHFCIPASVSRISSRSSEACNGRQGHHPTGTAELQGDHRGWPGTGLRWPAFRMCLGLRGFPVSFKTSSVKNRKVPGKLGGLVTPGGGPTQSLGSSRGRSLQASWKSREGIWRCLRMLTSHFWPLQATFPLAPSLKLPPRGSPMNPSYFQIPQPLLVKVTVIRHQAYCSSLLMVPCFHPLPYNLFPTQQPKWPFPEKLNLLKFRNNVYIVKLKCINTQFCMLWQTHAVV